MIKIGPSTTIKTLEEEYPLFEKKEGVDITFSFSA